MPVDYQLIEQQLLEQDYAWVNNFLPLGQFKHLQSKAQQLLTTQQFEAAKIGNLSQHNANNAIRSDKTFWFDEQTEPELNYFFVKINQLKELFNERLFLSLADVETHFAFYDIGCRYHKHIDQFNKKKTRILSFVYYLNEQWQLSDGGTLQLYDHKNNPLQLIVPEANHLIIFKSDLPHEVHITHRERFSITGWMKTRDPLFE